MKTPIDPTIAELVDLLDENKREMFEERAAQRQFSADFSPEYAEAMGLADVLSKYPEALTNLEVFQLDVDDEPRFFVSSSEQLLREHAASLGGEIATRRSVAWTVDEEFGGLAELVAV
jgi:tetrahydromethanopterin S-methyltransferase subunit H